MKKIISVLSILFFAVNAAHAADKVAVKFGGVGYKATTGAVASSFGSDALIVIGGSKGTTVGTFTFSLEASEIAQLAKGVTFDVASTADDANDDNAT